MIFLQDLYINKLQNKKICKTITKDKNLDPTNAKSCTVSLQFAKYRYISFAAVSPRHEWDS